MQPYTRFCLTANIEHFTTLLQNRQLDEKQEAAVRLLLAESRIKLAEIEADGMPLVHRFPAIPLPTPTARTAPSATPPGG
jgi:hypothetical protein